MKYHYFATLALGSLAAVSCSCEQQKLNVIYIMTDDQGFGDTSYYGNENLQTPNIDQIAKESCRFENFHSNTTSSPTRASLLTGRYNNLVGVWHTIMGRNNLDPEATTIAEIFADNGYATGMFGKWHVGDNYPYRPNDRGFQETLWFRGGMITQIDDAWGNDCFDDVYMSNNTPVQQEGYCTDIFVDAAMDFIKRKSDAGEPFFCYIPTNAPHGYHHVEERYSKQFENNEEIPYPAFYGMIANLDENIGRLNKFIKEEGLDKNTVVVFTTDNGSQYGATFDKERFVVHGYNAGMRGPKGSTYEGGHHVPFFINIPNHKSLGTDIKQLSGVVDVLPTLCDLLDLEVDSKTLYEMDGISLMPVINGERSQIDRYLFTDSQRAAFLDKKRPSCVMRDDWRLVNRKELYNIATDPGQRHDVAKEQPELVAAMLAEHDKWWDRHEGLNDKMSHIAITNHDGNGEAVEITCHDFQNPRTKSANDQYAVRNGVLPDPEAYLAIEVIEDGAYDIELSRWPYEINTPLGETVPAGGPIPNGVTFPKGVMISGIYGARIAINDEVHEVTAGVDPMHDRCVTIPNVKMSKGKYTLHAALLRKGAEPFGAQYVRFVKR